MEVPWLVKQQNMEKKQEEVNWIFGKKVQMRPITDADTDLIVKWRNDKVVSDRFVYREPFTRESQAKWMRDKIATGQVVQFMVCPLNQPDHPVGSAYLRDITPDEGWCEFGMFFGEADGRGKGYGTEALRLSVDYARDVLKMKKVISRMFTDNPMSEKTTLAYGYHFVKLLPDVLCSDGQRKDMYLYEVDF